MIRTGASLRFLENLDAFSSFVHSLVVSCTKPDEEQLFRYLMEVRVVTDTIIAIV